MKKIRVDYYHYRLHKGRMDILLQPVDDPLGAYCIPFHYVKKEDGIDDWYERGHVYDDGDFVFCVPKLNEIPIDDKGQEWITLDKARTLTILRNESLYISKCIFTFFLHLCPREGESGNKRKAADALEEIKIERAKKKYVAWLENIRTTSPHPELIQEEIRTLKHFCVHRPSFPPLNLRDGMLDERDEYDFERPTAGELDI